MRAAELALPPHLLLAQHQDARLRVGLPKEEVGVPGVGAAGI